MKYQRKVAYFFQSMNQVFIVLGMYNFAIWIPKKIRSKDGMRWAHIPSFPSVKKIGKKLFDTC